VATAFGWLMWATLSLSERRAAFVSAVTHELRTPLTTFRLYTEMLSEGLASDPEQQQVYFQTLNREANRLTHLVENVLAYARLEHGRSTARNETLSLGNLFDRFVPRLEQRVAETPLSLTFHLDESDRSAKVTTNAMAVEQILFNLVDNACKYTRDAADLRILCNVELDGDQVRIQVCDFGPGLSSQARHTLFQPFQKSSSEAAETAPGVGLGLALSHRLACELKGSLQCKTNNPCGLCFELRLPINA
jgi:signal transduction histidine kinase